MKTTLKKVFYNHVSSSRRNFLQDLRYEVHLTGVRIGSWLFSSRRSKRKDMMEMRDIKLHWGCGGTQYDGWLNVDGWPTDATDYVHDLRLPLPFAEGSVSLIFSEHVLEHFTREDGQAILEDFFLIMAPGAWLRILVPDLRRFATAYVQGDHDWLVASSLPYEPHSAALNSLFYRHAHRCMYDSDLLGMALSDAGFANVHETEPHCSSVPELNRDATEPHRMTISLAMDAQKPLA